MISQFFSTLIDNIRELLTIFSPTVSDMEYKIKDYRTFCDKRFNIDVEYFDPKRGRWEGCQISLRNYGTLYYINGTLDQLVVTYPREEHNKWGNYLVEQVKKDSQIKDELTKFIL